MERINLSSIKKESVKNIFRVVSEKENTSRAEIAKETGLSLMTVGKVVDALLEREIIVQKKEAKNSAGRRAGMVKLNSDKFCIVLDLTTRQFSMTVIDVYMHVLDKMDYEYNDDFYFEENIFLFFKNVKIYALRRLNMAMCIGVGVSVPGEYNEVFDVTENCRIPELANIHMQSVITEILGEQVSVIEQDTYSAAISNMFSIENYALKNIAYVSLATAITGTILCQGEVLSGGSGVAIGNMLVHHGRKLNEVLLSDGITEETLPDLVMALYNYSLSITTDVIVIENRLPCRINDIEERLQGAFAELFAVDEKTPKILLSKAEIPHAHKGLALAMRTKWLEKEILQ